MLLIFVRFAVLAMNALKKLTTEISNFYKYSAIHTKRRGLQLIKII